MSSDISIIMTSHTRNFNKSTDLLIVILAILIIPKASMLLTSSIYPSLQYLDPDQTFLFKTIHHLFQLSLTICLMLVLTKREGLSQWGFNLRNVHQSMRWIGTFAIIFGGIEYFRITNAKLPEYDFELNQRNKIGIQSFQYLLSGLCEEPLFRGFVMIFLSKHWKKVYKFLQTEIPVTAIIATFLFMLAHLDIDLTNLSITGFDFDQQMKSLQLGVIYALGFHYTKSLLAPIIIHGLSNGLMYSIAFYLV